MWVTRKRLEALEKQVQENKSSIGLLIELEEKSNHDMKRVLAEIKDGIADSVKEIGNAILEEVDKKLQYSGHADIIERGAEFGEINRPISNS